METKVRQVARREEELAKELRRTDKQIRDEVAGLLVGGSGTYR